MANIGNLNIRVGFNGSEATKGLADLSNELAKFGNDTEKHFEKFNKLGQLIGSLGSGGGFSLAAIAGIGVGIAKMVGNAAKLAVEFEKAGHSADSLKAQMDEIARKNLEWNQMGVIGKTTSIGGEATDSLMGSLANAIKGLGEFADHLMGISPVLDDLRMRLGEIGRGEAGPISGILDMIPGLKSLNDWSDKLVGAQTLDEKRAAKAAQADVIAREKAAGKERQLFESNMEKLRETLSSSTMTAEEKFQKELEDLLKIQQQVFSRGEGRQFADVAMLAEKRRQQLIQEQADKQAELAKKQQEEQQRLIDEQKKLADAAAAAAKKLADELESLVNSVRTPSESFSNSLMNLQQSLAEAVAAGDATRMAVYQRKIGQLGAGILSNVPEVRHVDPFAGVSLAGTNQAYQDIIRSLNPPEERSVQERLAEGIEEMNRKSEEDLQIQQEIYRILSGQQGARVAHLIGG